MIRPRGWHLMERHLEVDGQADGRARCSTSASTPSTTPRPPSPQGSGPYFYLPKLESHLEARLWNDVFVRAQQALGLPVGTIKATVLIETLPAAFEMDEILYELTRPHRRAQLRPLGLHLLVHQAPGPHARLPDAGPLGQVVMGKAFLHAYSLNC